MKYPARMTDVVIIPGGSFVMGCERGQDNERPCHRVWVDSFGIGRFPVTNREYKIFADDTRISMPDFFADQCSARLARDEKRDASLRQALGQQAHLSRFATALGAFKCDER